MIDFHSHILPHLDDGAANTRMSIDMINEEMNQGCDIICATSHYYATDESPSSFLKRRQESYDKLKAQLPQTVPEIKLGAEVQYFEGITRVDEIEQLKIQDSSLLLVEMPFSKWSSRMINDVLELNRRSDVNVLLAHVERYMSFNADSVFEELADSGVILQSNASFFLGLLTRRKAVRMLERGVIQLLGSDCHNMDERKPRLKEAYSFAERKLGSEKINDMNKFGHDLFSL